MEKKRVRKGLIPISKKLLSLLLAIAMLFTMMVEIDLSVHAATNHTQQEAVNWINSQVGKRLDYDGAYGAQCVDLIYYYYQYLGVAVQGGNGSDYAWNTLPSGWKRINYYNGFTPQGGDIGVWSGVNHVGIWTSSGVFVDQNSNGRSYVASNSNLASIGLSLASMTCVIRPDFKTSVSLSAPTNVKYKCYENKVKITWDSVSGANCYDVIVTDPSGTTNWYHSNGTEKEITITKKGGYRFNVQSLYRQNGNTAGQIVGAHSSECYFELNIYGPTNVNVNCSGNKMKVTWDAADGADCYDVIVTDPSGTTNWYHTTGTDKEIAVSKVGVYSIDVQSLYRPNGNTTGQIVGAHSKAVIYNLNSIETTLAAPIIKAVTNSNGSFTISWDEVANADKYEVYCYDDIYNDYILYKTTTATMITTDIGTPGVTYSYKVKAIDSKNNYAASMFSDSVYVLNEEHIHTWNSGVVTKAATCTANGVKRYTCTTCGETKTEKIKATGHSYDAGKVTKAPTATTAGVKTYTCTKCKATKTETIKATGLKTPVLKAVVNANGTIKLSWGKVAEAEKYELYIKQADGSYKLMKTTNATSFTTAFATYGKQFTYKMRAVTGNVKSAYSAAVNATNTKKLQTPTMKAAVNANGTFKLSWNAVAGATSYQLYIKQADGSYKLMKTTNATSFTTAFATYGKQFTYKMRAVTSKNSSATSAYSSAVNAKNTKKLQTPTMKVTVNANGTFKLSWNAVAGATSYQLYIKQADGSYKLMKTTNATSFTTAFATYGKQFTYKMRAVTSKNSSATSAYSAAVNAKNTKKLQTPSLKVSVNKNGSFKLSWGKVTGATSYQIYMKQSNGSYKLIKTTSSTSFTTAVAAKGKTYSYKVRAVTSKNKNATSNYSSVVNAKRK